MDEIDEAMARAIQEADLTHGSGTKGEYWDALALAARKAYEEARAKNPNTVALDWKN